MLLLVTTSLLTESDLDRGRSVLDSTLASSLAPDRHSSTRDSGEHGRTGLTGEYRIRMSSGTSGANEAKDKYHVS